MPTPNGARPVYELKIVRVPAAAEEPPRYASTEPVTTSRQLYEAFRDRFQPLDREEFIVVLLDGKGRTMGFNVVSVGSLAASLVHPREVFKPAIIGNAASVVLLHNHPSGDPEPSAEDRALTRRLKEAGQLLGIRVIDHIVFGDGSYRSFADDGAL